MPLIPSLGGQSQADLFELEDSLVNRFSSQSEVHSEALSIRRGREDSWGGRRMTTLEGQ